MAMESVAPSVLPSATPAFFVRTMQAVQRAMAPGGRVLVVDSVMRSDSGPDQAKIFDLHLMLLSSGGRERTEEEFRALFASAGLELAAIHQTPVGLAIIEGRAVGAT